MQKYIVTNDYSGSDKYLIHTAITLCWLYRTFQSFITIIYCVLRVAEDTRMDMSEPESRT